MSSAGMRDQILDVVAEACRALGSRPVVLFDGPIDTVLTEEVRTNVLAVLREGLANVARHARASSVEIVVRATSSEVTLDLRTTASAQRAVRRPATGCAISIGGRQLGGSSDLITTTATGTVLHWAVPLSTS
jgi:signal transduction histidine kinase